MRRIVTILLASSLACLLLQGCGDDDPANPGNRPPGRSASFVRAPTLPTSVSDSLEFWVQVVATEETLASAVVDLRSNLDGVIASGAPDATGRYEVTVPPLSRGVHAVELQVSFGGSPRAYDMQVVQNILPARVVLLDPVIQPLGVALYWSTSDEPEFLRYEVRRWVDDETYDDSTVIASFGERTTTDLFDDRPPLAENVHYAVTVVIVGDLAAPSLPATAFRPNGPVLDFEPYDALIHPAASLVYLLDRDPNNSRLVAVDYLAKTLVADRTFTHAVQYMDVADNGLGVELYISRSDDGISVLDPLTLADITTVPLGYGTASVAADGRGHVWVSIGTGGWSPPPVRCYDRATWTLLDETGHYTWTRLECIPGRDELVEISMAISSGMTYHIQADAAGQVLAYNLLDRPDGSYRAHEVLCIDPTGSYLLTHIWGAVYTADADGTWLGNLPQPFGIYNDFAFSADGSEIYAALSTELGSPVFAAATLAQTRTVPLRGYPRRLFNDGTYLVSVGRPEMNTERVAVELVLLP